MFLIKDISEKKLLALLEQYPLDISLHAQDGKDEKTETATEARKRKAREEGDIYLTQELPQALLIVFPVLSILIFVDFFFNEIKNYFTSTLGDFDVFLVNQENVNSLLIEASFYFVKVFLPIGIISVVVVVLSTFLQTKFHFSTKKLKFDTNRIIPNWKKLRQQNYFH